MFGFLKRGSRRREPHPLLLENNRYFSRFDQSAPLDQYQFVVYDTELTGLNRRKDEIISIGAVRITNLRIDLDATFHRYIRPQNIQHTRATLVHKITPEQLRLASPMEEVLPEFIQFVGTALIVGHFLDLDMHFLNRATRKVLDGTLANPGIDTMRLAQGYNRRRLGYFRDRSAETTSYRLNDLCEQYKIPLFKAHDALQDALQTAYLFLFLVKKFKKGGLVTLRDLYKAGRG